MYVEGATLAQSASKNLDAFVIVRRHAAGGCFTNACIHAGLGVMLAYAQRVGAAFVVDAGALRTGGAEIVLIRSLNPASCNYCMGAGVGNQYRRRFPLDPSLMPMHQILHSVSDYF